MTQRVGPGVRLPEFISRYLHAVKCKMGMIMLPSSWGCCEDVIVYTECLGTCNVYSLSYIARAGHLLLISSMLQIFIEHLQCARHSSRPWGLIYKQEQ